MLRTCAAVIAVAFALAPTRARAADERVVIFCELGEDGFCDRLAAELVTEGFTADKRPRPSGGAAQAVLAFLASGPHPSAALIVEDAPRRVAIWARFAGRLESREFVPARPTDPADVLARQAAEFLRATFLAVDRAPSPAAVPSPSVEQLEPPAQEQYPTPTPELRAPRFSLAGGPGVVWSAGAAPVASLSVDADWMPSAHLALSLVADLPVMPANIDASEGSTRLYPFVVGLAVRYVADVGASWNVGVGAGLAALVVRMEGAAAGQYESRTDDAAAGLGFVEGRVGYALTESFRLRLGVRVGAAWPTPVVRFAGREVAQLGLPVVSSSIAAEWVIR